MLQKRDCFVNVILFPLAKDIQSHCRRYWYCVFKPQNTSIIIIISHQTGWCASNVGEYIVCNQLVSQLLFLLEAKMLELSSRKTCKDARCTLKPDWCCLLTAGWLSTEYDICLQKSAKAKPCIESFYLNDGQMTKIWRTLRCCRIWSAVEVQFSNWFWSVKKLL